MSREHLKLPISILTLPAGVPPPNMRPNIEELMAGMASPDKECAGEHRNQVDHVMLTLLVGRRSFLNEAVGEAAQRPGRSAAARFD